MDKLEMKKHTTVGYACQEAINTLCTNLSFSGKNTKRIMFTSCHSAEGKTFTVVNVMRTMATLGYRVVLVDADLRKSRIMYDFGNQFGIDKTKFGLAHFLAGRAEAEEILYQTDIPGAYFVPVGETVSNPLPLLSSSLFKSLLDRLAERADYVFVDAPPVGMVIDAAEISKSCDGIVLIVKHNDITRKNLIDVRYQLDQTGCPVLGAVLSMVDYESTFQKKYYRSYYSEYGYGYGRSAERKSEKTLRK